MEKIQNAHVVIDGETRLIRCEGCKSEETFRFPILVTMFVKQCRRFESEHEKCASQIQYSERVTEMLKEC